MSIPEFSSYGGLDCMDLEQIEFYRNLEKSINSKDFIDVAGNVSYLFVYVKDLISKLYQKDVESLFRKLVVLSERYKDYDNFSRYCNIIASDCLIALKKYEDYLIFTEDQFYRNNFSLDVRLTILLKLKRDVPASDAIFLSGYKTTPALNNYVNIFNDCFYQTYSEFVEKNGNIFRLLCAEIDKASGWHYLFAGAGVSNPIRADFKLMSFSQASETVKLLAAIARVAENKSRIHLGMPMVGAGWLSETTLYLKVKEQFSETAVLQHARPNFLGKQHYDIWIPNWKVAVEFHGDQHFRPVDFFGGVAAFEKNLERDERKIKLSAENGVKLLVVKEGYDIDELFSLIEVEKNNFESGI